VSPHAAYRGRHDCSTAKQLKRAPLGKLLHVMQKYLDESATPSSSGTHPNGPIAGEEVYVNADGEYFRVDISATSSASRSPAS